MIHELTYTNFHQEVEKSDLPYLVDFWAIWCSPCLVVSPILEEIANEFEDMLKIGKVNVDNEIKTADELGIQNIPTLIIFKDGEEVDRIIGAVPKAHLLKKIKKYISKGKHGGEKPKIRNKRVKQVLPKK
jgi:thioredoxin 1